MIKTIEIQDLITDIRYGFTGSATWNTNGIGFIRVTDIDDNGNVNYEQLPSVTISPNEAERYYLEPGDCVFARSGSVGKVHIYKGPIRKVVFASYLIRAKFDQSKIYPTYFGVFSRSEFYWKQIGNLQRGGVQQNLNTDAIGRIKIPLPPLPIQMQIAAILEKADAAREKRRQANQLTEQFFQSAFLEMFGDPVTNPKGWPTGIIADAIEYSEYGTSTKSNEEKRGYPIIGMANLTYDGQLELSNLKYVELSQVEFKKLKLEKGDVLFNRTNSTELIGKTAYWNINIDAVIASYLVKLRLTNKFNPIWFSCLLNTRYFKSLFMQRCKKAVNQSNISPTLLKEFPIYKPPLSEQQEFACLVEKVELLRAKQRESEKELENLFQSLMQRVFKGELVS